jgi:hypothetical protein
MTVSENMEKLAKDCHAMGTTQGRLDALNDVLDLLVRHNLFRHPAYTEVRAMLTATLEKAYPQKEKSA